MIYKVKSGFVLRSVAGSQMAVPVGKRTSELHGTIALTESGALLWRALENGADLHTLVKCLTDEYEIDEATAKTDIIKFLEGLNEQGALE